MHTISRARRAQAAVLAGSLTLALLGCQNTIANPRDGTAVSTNPAATTLISTPTAAPTAVPSALPSVPAAVATGATAVFGSQVTQALNRAKANTASNPTAAAVIDGTIATINALSQFTAGFTTQSTRTATTTVNGVSITATLTSDDGDPENWSVSLNGTTVATGTYARDRSSGRVTLMASALGGSSAQDATIQWTVSAAGAVHLTASGGGQTLTVDVNADGHGSYSSSAGSGTF